jgi:hypothetical protein
MKIGNEIETVNGRDMSAEAAAGVVRSICRSRCLR